MVKTYLADIKLLDALGMLQLHAVVCLCGWKCGAVVEEVKEGNAGKELSVLAKRSTNGGGAQNKAEWFGLRQELCSACVA